MDKPLADNTPVGTVAPITDADLAPIVDEAIARWTDTGVDTSVLSGVDVVVADLQGDFLVGWQKSVRVIQPARFSTHQPG